MSELSKYSSDVYTLLKIERKRRLKSVNACVTVALTYCDLQHVEDVT